MKVKLTQTHREALIENLFESMNTLKRGIYNHTSRTLPIPHSQIELLHTIRHSQPVSFKVLAQNLCLTPGAISQLAEVLERHKLISREADPNDRRIQCLRVTSSGEKLLRDVEKLRRSMLEAAIQDLDDEELEIWVRVQQKLISHFQAEIAKQTK